MTVIQNQIMYFLRGDLTPVEFETWICSNLDLEKEFGKELYWELMTANYSNWDEREAIVQKLEQFSKDILYPYHCATLNLEQEFGKELYWEFVVAKPSDFHGVDSIESIVKKLRQFSETFVAPYPCSCIRIKNLDVIAMGDESRPYLDTIERIKDRGDTYWWLFLSRCRACHAFWLIASEERINDVYCLKRLTESQGATILSQDSWPTEFDTYENLLRIGNACGQSATFDDPINSPSLVDTTIDLAKKRPNIGVRELSELLNIDQILARAIAIKAKEEEEIEIDFHQ